MIGRIRSKAPFDELRRNGRRLSNGPLSMTVVTSSACDRANVAFALPRRIGPAVGRNRLRRRCRSAFEHIDREAPLPGGWYLIVARPGAVELDYASLMRIIASMADRARSVTP